MPESSTQMLSLVATVFALENLLNEIHNELWISVNVIFLDDFFLFCVSLLSHCQAFMFISAMVLGGRCRERNRSAITVNVFINNVSLKIK